MVSYTSNADRYEIPSQVYENDQPKDGKCYNCAHRVMIVLDAKRYYLCVQERDDRKPFGEVYECDPEVTECTDWDWSGDEL